MEKFKQKSKVEWLWLGKPVSGTVEEVYTESVTKEIKGKKITRHGTLEKPAYLVRSEAGNLALKLATELRSPKATKKFDIKLFK
ncbi:MAG: DUF2945 domain-containing protein [Bdellovibrionales bacterium]|nr:DUF2945 domain-containing protein [Bdellovibrionales bacterium]